MMTYHASLIRLLLQLISLLLQLCVRENIMHREKNEMVTCQLYKLTP
jgi:hypothetical protein